MTISRLTDHLGYRLRAVSNHVSQSFAAKVASHGVTVAEWVLLRALFEEPPAAPSLLADTLGMTRGAITKLADRLIEKGYLTRSANPEDGRSQTLAITDKGGALVPVLAALADQNDAECFAALSAEERQNLCDLLTRLIGKHQLNAVPLA